ncbi:MAG: 5-bromo-4-chloroindolyl phosphate hydrolysis family protein [Veillonella sp.]|uniref:5-bromo-4-chloroindolyl phosphate hydrolysis family protein n=1 Tax=Veillonella sp. TaxID=1926307 RepID=UPI0025FA2F0B|nr:5-bromo-4-chloroindolyl phosphate hydrolysis family protein [Veillonella sp.]MBS4912603.1 5-bromo-4-chloroindolyl phosphate hydrolysis family protein [Veillonella sp.]
MRFFMFIVALLCFIYAFFVRFKNITGLIAFGLGILALKITFRRKKKSTQKQDVFTINPSLLNEFSEELYTKAVSDFKALDREIKLVNDKEFKKQLRKLQDMSKNFLIYLQNHPERITVSRRFIDYYQDRALLLVQKYNELDNTGLEEHEIQQSKYEIKKTLHYYDEVYTDQFTKAVNAQLFDLDAEIQVVKENMIADGLNPESAKCPPLKKKQRGLLASIFKKW